MEALLLAQQTALEIIVNMCCNEGMYVYNLLLYILNASFFPRLVKICVSLSSACLYGYRAFLDISKPPQACKMWHLLNQDNKGCFAFCESIVLPGEQRIWSLVQNLAYQETPPKNALKEQVSCPCS